MAGLERERGSGQLGGEGGYAGREEGTQSGRRHPIEAGFALLQMGSGNGGSMEGGHGP